MKPIEGYLIVLIPEKANRINHKYHGLDRLPPGSSEMYGSGFNNPYIDGNNVDDNGIISSIEKAHHVFSVFSKRFNPRDLEIIFIRTSARRTQQPLKLPDRNFIGYDVAGMNGFYSIVLDCSTNTEEPITGLINQLNAYGLFDSRDLANRYLSANLQKFSYHRKKGIRIWEIYVMV
jgi:hypothetical protein